MLVESDVAMQDLTPFPASTINRYGKKGIHAKSPADFGAGILNE